MTPSAGAPNVLIAGAEESAPLTRMFDAALNGAGAAIAQDRPQSLFALLELCAARGIGLIVPALDADLPAFADWRPELEAAGVRTLAPSPETVRACQDPYAFRKLLARYGYPEADPATAADDADIREISVDLLMDLEGGRPLQAVALERVLAPGGALKVATVIDAPDAAMLAMRLGAALGLVGHNSFRARLEGDRGPALVSLAPRFGDTALLSVKAGLDSPARILAMLAGDATAAAARPVRIGETLYRADRDLIVPGVDFGGAI